MINLSDLNLNRILKIAGAIAACFIIALFVWWNKEIIVISSNSQINTGGPASSIAGISCKTYNERPVAVMMPSDIEARPLSGIGRADIVFEMPVSPDGITRMMAVYQCEEPDEIGSIRSAREDFIPLAASLGAILVHWGGEHEALNQLNNHIIDNVDGLKYEGTTFYRKKGVKPPHNGFTNWNLVTEKVSNLGYGTANIFNGYQHDSDKLKKSIYNLADRININYRSPDDVAWQYNQDSNSYSRIRGGEPEIDKSSNQQVHASAVVLMKTTSKFLREQYISVNVSGGGEAQIYQNGIVINGKWSKDPSKLDSKLYFYDDSGKEVNFVPGKIWVEIVTSN